jgi:hypothetical protein
MTTDLTRPRPSVRQPSNIWHIHIDQSRAIGPEKEVPS